MDSVQLLNTLRVSLRRFLSQEPPYVRGQTERWPRRPWWPHYQRGGGPPDQRLDPGSRFNAKREVREPRKNKAAEKQNFDDITEKAMKKGTSKGGWKGAEALGIDFEM